MNTAGQFAICVAARDDEDLERWKVYRLVSDEDASQLGCLRVIDESGEDYLYPASRFITLDLPVEARERLMSEADADAVD